MMQLDGSNFIQQGAQGQGFQALGGGSVAQRLMLNGMKTNVLRPWIEVNGQKIPTGFYVNNAAGIAVPTTNATLRRDEWKQFDDVLIKIGRERLVGVADLESRGLTYSIGNGLGTTVLEHERISNASPAQFSMDARTRGRNDTVVYDTQYLPLPIVHADFQFNIRTLNSSRTTGASLDTTMIELETREVAEALESLLFVGTGGITFGGGTIYGYMNHPQRETYSLTSNWDEETALLNVVNDMIAMKQKLINNNFHGPYGVYLPTNYDTVLDKDFQSVDGWHAGTLRERLMKINGIEFIKVADKLTDDNVIMTQLSSDVVRMVNALPLQVVEWSVDGGMVFNFKVMAIKVPQIRANKDNKCGVVHAS